MAGSIAKRPDGRRARLIPRPHPTRALASLQAEDRCRCVARRGGPSTIQTGTYVNPRAGRVTFQDIMIMVGLTWAPSTRANADLAVGSVSFGGLPVSEGHPALPTSRPGLSRCRRSWPPTTIKTRFVIVRSVFRPAVAGPCDRGLLRPPVSRCRDDARSRRRCGSHREQVGKLLAHADSNCVSTRHGFRAYVALCAFAVLREGARSVRSGRPHRLHAPPADRVAAVAAGRREPSFGSAPEVRIRAESFTCPTSWSRCCAPTSRTPCPRSHGVHGRQRTDVRQRYRLAVARDADLGRVRRTCGSTALLRPSPRDATLCRAAGAGALVARDDHPEHATPTLWPTAEDRTPRSGSGTSPAIAHGSSAGRATRSSAAEIFRTSANT